MSDARSFAQNDVELSIEDRIAALEAKIPSYQARIAAYDGLFDEFHNLALKLEMEKEKTDGHRSALDKLGESVASLHNSQVERINKLQADLVTATQSTASSTQGIEAVRNSLGEKIAALWVEIVNLKEDVESSLLKKASNDLVEERSQGHFSQITNIASQIDSHRSVTKSMIDGLKGVIEEVKGSMVNASSYTDDFSEIMKKVATLKGEILNARDELPARIAQVEAKIAQSIDALRSEITSKPSDIVELKNDVSKRLESSSLEASSANIRSQNADKKIFLLEKQLENVQLLIKKLELK